MDEKQRSARPRGKGKAYDERNLGTASERDAERDPTSYDEYAVKAAFLFNFAKFVKWPAEADPNEESTIPICVLGADPFGPALDSIDGKVVSGRRVEVRRMKRLEPLEACRILFICKSEQERLHKILRTLKDTNVLTVGDMEGFAQIGGVINLIVVQGKVRFEINVDAAQQAGLKVSSQLLKLARIVSNESSEEKN